MALLEETGGGSTLIFTRTKHGADKIAKRLIGGKHTTGVLHGNRSQSQRVKALDGFRDGTVQILVATDIAARGIDVAGVTHVINYDVPRHPEDYVHRIGRTGRAQQIGDAFTLLSGAGRRGRGARHRAVYRCESHAQKRGRLPLRPDQHGAVHPRPDPA